MIRLLNPKTGLERMSESCKLKIWIKKLLRGEQIIISDSKPQMTNRRSAFPFLSFSPLPLLLF